MEQTTLKNKIVAQQVYAVSCSALLNSKEETHIIAHNKELSHQVEMFTRSRSRANKQLLCI